jgi:2-polyprenyl-6-methoxyphenol hydroxylase-like FAD-dependent oxidoreductase
MKNQKICIIGDGLAGLTAANSLAQLNIDIDLFYKKETSKKQKDKRTTAISESNYNFIKEDGVIKTKRYFWPIKKINLFYEDKKKFINFLNLEESRSNLMFVFENSKIKSFLLNKLKKLKNFKYKNHKISNVSIKESHLTINNKKINYDLIILCLGRSASLYKEIIKKRSIKEDNREIAITAVVQHNGKIKNASQYFFEEGPLAILPFKNNFFSFVWSIKDNKDIEKDKIKKKILEKFLIIFSKKIKFKINDIQFFKINLDLKMRYFKNNTLILGDGLHAVHPLAGQGFNLVIRDIKKLKEIVKKNISLGLTLKNSNVLNQFYNSRKAENTIFSLGINMTNKFFRRNKFVEPLKKVLLKKIHKSENVIKVTKYISNKGLLF